ncbi:MAG TPA: orotidine-5'-phosphate decarboxylase [Actinomycetaceae bacterium]|nr:orotidine-5'-phosphate decarboxylase [Actinomycetaceae bacterium]
MTGGFGVRLLHAMEEHGPLCVGIDPHVSLLQAWNLDDTPRGLREFSLRVVDALSGRVAALKPQSAFFERHGSAGIAVLEEVLGAARARGTITILDVKRGDIGSTMAGYADAYLRPGAPLEADSITLSPYLGPGSLDPAVALAVGHGKGVFALTLTSNPEGTAVQHASTMAGPSVAGQIVEWAAEHNAAFDPVGPVGLVVGATVGDAPRRLGIDLAAARGILLAPGLGAQGAGPEDVRRVFGAAAPYVLGSVSRGILAAGPGNLGKSAANNATWLRFATDGSESGPR